MGELKGILDGQGLLDPVKNEVNGVDGIREFQDLTLADGRGSKPNVAMAAAYARAANEYIEPDYKAVDPLEVVKESEMESREEQLLKETEDYEISAEEVGSSIGKYNLSKSKKMFDVMTSMSKSLAMLDMFGDTAIGRGFKGTKPTRDVRKKNNRKKAKQAKKSRKQNRRK